MNHELTKSLTDLIDETLQELEELKKSRFSAAEIDLKGPGEGIAGKPSDGKLDAAKAEDKKDEDEKEDAEEDKAEKADGGDPADSPEVKRKLKGIMGKAEDAEKAEDKKEKDEDKKDKEEPHKDDSKHEEKEKKMAKELLDMHKSQEEMSSLMKSFVEERVRPLEDKLSTILDLVNKIADQPVEPKGVTARTAPLFKSTDEGASEPLSKAQVASKLWDLKKSGSEVDSLDVTKAEMGQDLETIVKKYKLS